MGNPIYDLMYRGESGAAGYNAYNRGTHIDANNRERMRPLGPPVDFSQYTLGEILEMQHRRSSDPDRVFALGKYQIIPETMDVAVRFLHLDTNQRFTPELQDRIFSEYLLWEKQPAVSPYITGQQGASLQAAQLGLAQEWASFPDPNKGGRSHYGGANQAHITLEQSAAALTQLREQYRAAISQGMSRDEAWRVATVIDPEQRQMAMAPSRTADDPTIHSLQQNLNQLGITDAQGRALTVDGERGGRTNEAIATFQQRFGLQRSQMSNTDLLMASQVALNANPIRNLDQALHNILPESMQPKPSPGMTNGLPHYLRVNPTNPPQRAEAHDAMSDGVLKQGESGPEVRRLQEALNQQGAHLPLTGNFLDQTKSAVEGFQRDHGLEVDGKAGRDTLNALGIGPSAPMAEPPAPQRATPVGTQAPDKPLRLGDRGTEVLALQASLIQLNINDRIKMPVEVNGVYGVETQRAVQAFQLWHGMDEVNGIADRATRDAVQQQAGLAIAQRAIDQAQGQPVKDFATNASLGAQIDWRDAATLRDPNQSDSQPVPPPPAPAPARQVTARDYEALGWTPPYVTVASQSQEQSGHDHEQQEQQARQQQQHREWQVQQDQRMQEQGRLKEEETGREEERSKEQQPALRPFSDPKHPEHGLYADLKQRLEAQGHSFPEDRLHQIVGALHDEWFKPGWRGAVDVKNDSVYVRDNDRPWARSQTLLQEPAPSLQDTMQLVQQKDLEKAQQRSQSPDTPTQGPTR